MGDFSANFHRPESGIHTVEGNVAGTRAAFLSRKREAAQKTFEEKKAKLRDISSTSAISNKRFESDAKVSNAEETFRQKTIGLVSASDFKKAAREVEVAKKDAFRSLKFEEKLSSSSTKKEEAEKASNEEKRKKRKMNKKKLKERKKALSTLSFAEDEEIAEELLELEQEKQKEGKTSSQLSMKKDPSVDTSFLPDKVREEQAFAQREKLKREWLEKQEATKKEMLEITYSYWDGSGHRRSVVVKKGDTIGTFLEATRKDLSKEFRELANISSEALVYVKEDLIIPQDITFYDLIATKARGKSGPLFNFDVHDDVRVGAIDRRVEKDESHPGKVVERRWYDRNKHIFPASRWELFDPSMDYGKYTIHGGELHSK